MPCPDDYSHLIYKTQAFCQWAVEHGEFDFLFKCDDDSYVDVERLLKVLPSAADYQGHCLNGYASGGAGYLLSHRAAQIVAAGSIASPDSEDQTVGRWLSEHQISLTPDSRFHLTNDIWPTPENQIITSHHITPERMRAIHAQLLAPHEPIT